MGKGRKPVPTRLKILRGNPGKRAIKKEPAPAGRAECPDWLDGEAKAEWHRVAPELERLKLLTLIDRAALAAYCQAWEEFRKATESLKNCGRYFETETGIRSHPAVAQQRSAWAAIRAFAAEFGFSPSARTKVKPGDGEKGDDFDEFMRA